MPYSLRNLLFSIISGFLLVIAVSLTLNQVTLKAHISHNNVLSVAYHLRMTTQQIIIRVSSSGNSNPDLTAAVEDFDQALNELIKYGEPQDRPIGDLIIFPSFLHKNYNTELDAISTTWLEFTADRDKLSGIPPSDTEYAVTKMKAMSTLANLFAQVDSFSNTLENLDDMQDKNQAIEQYFILGAGLLLLFWGWYVIIFRVVRPLGYLDAAVRGIGQGGEIQSINVNANDELGRLSRTYETMRREISAAQKLLEDRVDERTRILTDAFEFSQEVVSQPDFRKLVDSITRRTENIMRTKSVSLCLATHDLKRLELVSKSGRSKSFLGAVQPWADVCQRGRRAPRRGRGREVDSNGGAPWRRRSSIQSGDEVSQRQRLETAPGYARCKDRSLQMVAARGRARLQGFSRGSRTGDPRDDS